MGMASKVGGVFQVTECADGLAQPFFWGALILKECIIHLFAMTDDRALSPAQAMVAEDPIHNAGEKRQQKHRDDPRDFELGVFIFVDDPEEDDKGDDKYHKPGRYIDKGDDKLPNLIAVRNAKCFQDIIEEELEADDDQKLQKQNEED